MPSQFQNFQAKLGISNPRRSGVGYNFAPFIVGQGEQSPGQRLIEKVNSRKQTGQEIYTTNKQESTNRLAKDLLNKSAGLSFDEFGRPDITLTDFSQPLKNRSTSIGQRGKLALQTEEAKRAWQNASDMQNLGQYGVTGSVEVNPSGTSIPGANSKNPGARAAAIAMQAAKNNVNYVWGGNSLVNGVDCSGLVQQAYKQLGIKVPRTTWEQAKFGKKVSVREIRPGDLVFYRNYGHVGIYVGNGKIVHAANSKLGVITSNLTNSNGAPLSVLRPY